MYIAYSTDVHIGGWGEYRGVRSVRGGKPTLLYNPWWLTWHSRAEDGRLSAVHEEGRKHFSRYQRLEGFERRECEESAPLLMYCGGLPSSAPWVPSQSSGLYNRVGLPPSHSSHHRYSPHPLCAHPYWSNIHQHSSGLCDLVTMLYSHDMLHVLLSMWGLGKTYKPFFFRDLSGLGYIHRVASNYRRLYSQDRTMTDIIT